MNLALPTGVARLFLGWQLPPHATPVDPPLILLTVVFIPASANWEEALTELYSMISKYENTYPDAAFVVLIIGTQSI